MSLEQLTRRLETYQPRELAHANCKPAAVLIPILSTRDGLSLLFTLRPAGLGVHGGQVSFPGGRVDDSDGDRWTTALREAEEEIGLEQHQVRRLGVLDDYITVTHYHVSPRVALITSDVTFQPNPDEVERIFTVPLDTLRDSKRRRTFWLQTSSRDARAVHFFPVSQPMIWGATGAILMSLLRVLDG